MLKWFADRLARTGDEVRKDERGFTLIELLVVVIIIGILAAIAIPVFLNQRGNANDAAAETGLRNAATAQQAYYTENGSYTDDKTALADYGFPTNNDPVVNIADSSGGDTYCMTTSDPSFYITESSGSPQSEGSCTAGDGGGD